MGINPEDINPKSPLGKKILAELRKDDSSLKSKKLKEKPLDMESQLQQRAVKVFRLQYPKLKYRLWATPNGGHRHVAVAAKLKREGVLAGVWDLFLAVPVGKYHGLFIETKWGDNKLSDTQRNFRTELSADYAFFVYYDLDTFLTQTKAYLEGNL